MQNGYDRQYDTYALLGDTNVPPIWHWTPWQRVSGALNPLVAMARAKAAVRSLQNEGRKTVPFGRIGWTDKDHSKWVHGSPTNNHKSHLWRLFAVEIGAPALTTCYRERIPPEFFCCILNEAEAGGMGQPLAFNPVIVLAVAQDLGEAARLRGRAAVATLIELINAKLSAYRSRPWGYPPGVLMNSIENLGYNGLFKVGPRHDWPVSLDSFAEEWRSFGE